VLQMECDQLQIERLYCTRILLEITTYATALGRDEQHTEGMLLDTD